MKVICGTQLAAVIDKMPYAKRDTLAMSILCNAHRAVELALKFTTKRLHAARVIADRAPHRNYEIKVQWNLLHDADIGDREFRTLVLGLRPFVDSLHGVDGDGQQLRYSETHDGRQSLSGEVIWDLEVIRASPGEPYRVLSDLRCRITRIEERGTETYTRVCSRADLYEIARTLPPRERWSTARIR